MMKSRAKFGEACANIKLLLGALAGKFDSKGIELDPVVTRGGCKFAGRLLRSIGLELLDNGFPPSTLALLGPLNAPVTPNCVPMSRAKLREACTTRASISTCCDRRSSWRIR